MKRKFLDKYVGNEPYHIALLEIQNFRSKINAVEDFALNIFCFF